MTITPNTTIILLKSPLTLDNKNQITFSDATAQANYFLSLPKIEVDANTYQRANSFIRFSGNYDDLIGYNYCMYKNEDYNNKWFYAFITGKEYVNGSVTNVYLKQDVFQSWQFDIIYKKSFVEREHVDDDTIGLHTIDEGIGVGEVTQEGNTGTIPGLGTAFYVCVESQYKPNGEDSEDYVAGGVQFSGVNIVTGQVSPNLLFFFTSQGIDGLDLQELETNLQRFLYRVNKDGHIEDIKNMYIVPAFLVDNMQKKTITLYTDHTASGRHDEPFTFFQPSQSFSSREQLFNLNKKYSFSDITVQNNKCYTYPFNYLYVTNNVGNSNIYKYEDFKDTTCRFRVNVGNGCGCSGKLTPIDYKTDAIYENFENNDEAIPLAKYPVCSWSADAYTNWLTQQGTNEFVNDIFSIARATSGAISGASSATSGEEVNKTGVATGVADFGLNIAGIVQNRLQQFHLLDLLPNIQGGSNTADVNFTLGQNNFYFKYMHSKPEYMKQIDDFFTMFGYKVNELKIPNITGRANHNYIKTTVCNILGNIPQEDLQELKTIFNNGVTLWHNTANFLNYDANNNII